MNNIKNIKLFENSFIVNFETSSLKLNCKIENDKCLIDISKMNIINATKMAIFCSTYCFINNFKEKLCWIVADEEIKRAISILRLKNIETLVKEKAQTKKAVLVS